MDLVRFSSSQRYGSRVPLRQLAFRVTVSRAFLIEEEAPEVLCETTVPWGGKLPSPQERLSMYAQLESALSSSTAAPTAVVTEGQSAELADDGGDRQQQRGRRGGSADLLPPAAALREQLNHPAARLFTRPPVEDFIDEGEQHFPVDPPQGPSLLAPIILRQHRREHLPNNNMFIMWATGAVTGAEEAEGAEDATTPASPPALQRLSSLRWEGEERVMCTITAERNDSYFTAKPDLDRPHTLLVDAVHIYSFVVRAVDMADLGADGSAAAGGGVAGTPPLLQDAAMPAATAAAALAAADDVTAGVRALAAQAEKGFHALHLSTPAAGEGEEARPGAAAGGAAGQALQLLREAAMALPKPQKKGNELRAGADAIISSAAAESVAAPLEMGGSGNAAREAASSAGPAPPRRLSFAVGGGGDDGDGRERYRYFIFGVVERCVGLPFDNVFLKCLLQQDTSPGGRGGVEDVPMFFQEQEALGAYLATAGGAQPPPPSARQQQPRPLMFSTQLAYAGAVTVEEHLIETDHVFNAPFEFAYTDDALPAAPLRLAVAAFTEGIGADGHQTPVGYCSVSLPVIVAGSHAVDCPLWTPHKSGKEFVKAVMVGGGPSLVDVRESGPALRNRTGVGVKQGMLADSTGVLQLKINVLRQRDS